MEQNIVLNLRITNRQVYEAADPLALQSSHARQCAEQPDPVLVSKHKVPVPAARGLRANQGGEDKPRQGRHGEH